MYDSPLVIPCKKTLRDFVVQDSVDAATPTPTPSAESGHLTRSDVLGQEGFAGGDEGVGQHKEPVFEAWAELLVRLALEVDC